MYEDNEAKRSEAKARVIDTWRSAELTRIIGDITTTKSYVELASRSAAVDFSNHYNDQLHT